MSEKSPQVAIVTGAGRGLGREFALHLATNGHHVVIVDVRNVDAEETAKLVTERGGTAQVEIADVTLVDAWMSLRERLQARWPRLDLLVNNAGMYAAGSIGSLDLSEAERLLRLNLSSVLYGCHVCVPWLVASAKSSRTRIINVASSFAFLCPPGMAPYNLSKAAVVALSETLYGELRQRNVGVTVVCPGPMPTRFVESATFESDDLRRLTEFYVKNSSLDPSHVVSAALDASARGQLYVVEGSDQRWYWRAKRWLPTMLLGRVARRVRKDLKDSQRTTDH